MSEVCKNIKMHTCGEKEYRGLLWRGKHIMEENGWDFSWPEEESVSWTKEYN